MAALSDLTFINVQYGKLETPWSFNSLYYKGLSSIPIDQVTRLIAKGNIPLPNKARENLARRFYQCLQGEIDAGKSPRTIKSTHQVMRSFYAWGDANGKKMIETSIEQTFLDWCDWMLDRARGNTKSEQNAFSRGVRVGSLIDNALGRTRTLISYSRLRKKTKPKDWGKNSDKINFEKLFSMGGALLDICNSLKISDIKGPIPIALNFRSGVTIPHWSGLIPTKNLKWGGMQSINKKPLIKRAIRMADTSWGSRYSVMNLRIEAEILIFIAQTQMNLTQVLELPNDKFTYQSVSNGYRVDRLYKERREGEVSFSIFSEYRLHFEKYLEWRNLLYPRDGLLFPLRSHFERAPTSNPKFGGVRKILDNLSIEYITPRALRDSKVNWLLRRTRDPSLTAEMAQHTEATLLQVYDKPNHQAALAELTRYHQKNDAALEPPGPGVCIEAQPIEIFQAVKGTPKPDCTNPAGCMFCEHQRDIAEFDHVWSLFSYRYLKSVELATNRPTSAERGQHPASMVIDAITKKIEAFSSTPEFKPWIAESATRLEEGRHHPKWDGFIRLMESRL
ncbi:hypothetical protein [Pseudomonas sp. Ga0074129]|uniref:hypothetical protein n=1 Tax=Pseudomonas sp. Ga0074129 TaxID=1752219 RepID=UPI000AFF39F1|nr:hypothetical protein [Pseudomonas sp. Ga0074129]